MTVVVHPTGAEGGRPTAKRPLHRTSEPVEKDRAAQDLEQVHRTERSDDGRLDTAAPASPGGWRGTPLPLLQRGMAARADPRASRRIGLMRSEKPQGIHDIVTSSRDIVHIATSPASPAVCDRVAPSSLSSEARARERRCLNASGVSPHTAAASEGESPSMPTSNSASR